jgi:hypothetical protein
VTAADMFPEAVIAAQMNTAEFWRNTAVEMAVMVDLAAEASAAWGPISISRLRGMAAIVSCFGVPCACT